MEDLANVGAPTFIPQLLSFAEETITPEEMDYHRYIMGSAWYAGICALASSMFEDI